MDSVTRQTPTQLARCIGTCRGVGRSRRRGPMGPWAAPVDSRRDGAESSSSLRSNAHRKQMTSDTCFLPPPPPPALIVQPTPCLSTQRCIVMRCCSLLTHSSFLLAASLTVAPSTSPLPSPPSRRGSRSSSSSGSSTPGKRHSARRIPRGRRSPRDLKVARIQMIRVEDESHTGAFESGRYGIPSHAPWIPLDEAGPEHRRGLPQSPLPLRRHLARDDVQEEGLYRVRLARLLRRGVKRLWYSM